MKNNFPKDFIWGTATSSYQIEGAHDKEGKGPSIWDAFCQIPGKVARGDHGNIACDHFHRLEEDVALLDELGVKAYRFSISWPRILPDGTTGNINQEGIDFYNRLIDLLLQKNIEPWVTLYHWDLPLALQLEYDGWLGEKIPDLFADYAEVCFKNFGDRVKNWITINEAWVVAMLGHGQGVFAPGRTSDKEPYLAGHQLVLAHAKAVEVFRTKYQPKFGGKIGITNNCDWREPLSDSLPDIEAAQRALEFFLAWFADPIYLGDYPQVMKDRLGERLPEFSDAEKLLIKGSSDFFGLNHYTTMYAAEAGPNPDKTSVYGNGGISKDQMVDLSQKKDWNLTSMNWAIVPWGCRKLLEWITERYDAPDIYITENGCSFPDELVDGKVEDQWRIDFLKGYLAACEEAIQNGVQLKGYFLWSFLDNFEWASGYEKRFGITYVDFETLERTPKASAKWYKEFIEQ